MTPPPSKPEAGQTIKTKIGMEPNLDQSKIINETKRGIFKALWIKAALPMDEAKSDFWLPRPKVIPPLLFLVASKTYFWTGFSRIILNRNQRKLFSDQMKLFKNHFCL